MENNTAPARFDAEVLKLLDARQRRPRSVYKLSSGSVGMDTITRATVDENTMSASAVISTPSPDRDGDIMLPRGVRLENYRKNPVVLWEHGLGGIHTPVATSEDQHGRLAVRVGDDRIEATSFFSGSVRESEQVFALIAERIVRAASIRGDVIKSRIEQLDGEKFFIAEEWELIEWSWGGLGVNPDAVAKIISRNRLAGGPICEPVLKSLRPYAPVPAAWSPGISSPGISSPGISSPEAQPAAESTGAGSGNGGEASPRESAAERGRRARLERLEKTISGLRQRLHDIAPPAALPSFETTRAQPNRPARAEA